MRQDVRLYGAPARLVLSYMLGIPPGIFEGRSTYEKNRVLGNDFGRRPGQPLGRAHKAGGKAGGSVRGEIPHH